MKQVSISTGEIAFVDRGDGPAVLLVHGFPLDHSMWSAQIEALASCARVVAPDLRGMGQSPLGSLDASGAISMERRADDLAELLDAVGVQGDLTLVGFSMGGYVAWQFWRKYGARVSALVQCDTRAIADTEEGRDARLTMARNVAEWGSGRVFEMMKEKLFAPSTLQRQREIVDAVRRVVERTPPSGIAAAQRGMATRPDVTDMLSSIGVPTLVLCGAEDAISAPSEMRAIAEAIPNATFVEIPSAGHMTTVENPGAVNEALVRFVAAR